MKTRALVMVFAGIALFGRQPAPAKRSQVDAAWDLLSKDRGDEAVQLLRTLIGREPQNADARLLLGSVLTERRQGPEAIEQLTAAVHLRPNSAEVENALGEAYSAFNEPKQARSAFEQAVRLDAKNGIAQLNLGKVLLQSNELAGASENLDLAIKLLGRKDDAADAYYLRAKVSSEQNDPAKAMRQLQEAVAIRPNFTEAWSDLGEVRSLLQDDAGATEAYRKAVESNPSDAVAQYRLGSAYLRSGNAHEAAVHLDAAYRLNPEDQSTLNSLQAALRKDGRAGEANDVKHKLAALLRARDLKNQNELAALKMNNEGAGLEKTGDLKGAREKYQEALRLYPEHNGIRVNYAIALLRTGEWTDGLNELHEALKIDPGNPAIQKAFKDALSQAPMASIPKWSEMN